MHGVPEKGCEQTYPKLKKKFKKRKSKLTPQIVYREIKFTPEAVHREIQLKQSLTV